MESGSLQAGQSVLVHGTGGVALYGVLWALAHGAEALVVTSSEAKAERVRALGATAFLRGDDWPRQVRAHTRGRGVDHVLETVGGDNLAASLAVVAQAGQVAVVGMLGGVELRLPFYPLIMSRVRIAGIGVGHRRSLEDAVRAAERTPQRPVVSELFPAAQLPEALSALARGAFGKVVVRFP